MAEEQQKRMPQKKFYRSRAHCNPMSHNDSFEYPTRPCEKDWTEHYPAIKNQKVTIVDVGCGFGGLTVSLSEIFPEEQTLAMEIRPKVCEYVRLRIEALREKHPGKFQNVSVLKTNAMRYLPNLFYKGQLKKMFFCFPDPHFKSKNYRRRIVNEYAYLLSPGGMLYTITDVEDLHQWHVAKCEAHPCFIRVPQEELEQDPCVRAMSQDTEESKKVARGGGQSYYAVFRRLPNEQVKAKELFA